MIQKNKITGINQALWSIIKFVDKCEISTIFDLINSEDC
jgi:hypothetical protein